MEFVEIDDKIYISLEDVLTSDPKLYRRWPEFSIPIIMANGKKYIDYYWVDANVNSSSRFKVVYVD